MTHPEPTSDAQLDTDRQAADLADACALLQGELDGLLGDQDGQRTVESLDGAVASLKEVEQRNVSSVQLVALAS